MYNLPIYLSIYLYTYIIKNRLNAQDSIKCSVRIITQVRLSSQLKLGDNLNKSKRKIFWNNFGRNFVNFVKIYSTDTFCCFVFFILLVRVQVGLSAQSQQASTQKILFLSKCPGRLSDN